MEQGLDIVEKAGSSRLKRFPHRGPPGGERSGMQPGASRYSTYLAESEAAPEAAHQPRRLRHISFCYLPRKRKKKRLDAGFWTRSSATSHQ